MEIIGKNMGAAPAGEVVKDVTVQSFMQDVLQASLKTPVLAYFWSPRFEVCATFGALLEKQVQAAQGAIRLARVNIDAAPEIALQFRIQAVPTIYIFHQGQPVDAFSGQMPEAEIKKLIMQLTGHGKEEARAVEALLADAGKKSAAGEHEAALALYSEILETAPDHAEALGGMARSFLAMNDKESAEALLANVPESLANNEHITGARKALALLSSNAAGENTPALQQKLAQNPNDHEARLELARALFAQGDAERALEELLASIRLDREWNEQAARKELLQFFKALGHAHPLTAKGRRALSSILFS